MTGKVYRRMHKGVIMTDIWSGTAWNCEHGTQRHNCAKCGGRSVCEHGKHKDRCKKCGGPAFCEHGKLRHTCVVCGGTPAQQ